MSRVGKHPVPLPEGVEVALGEGSVAVKGSRGALDLRLVPEVTVSLEEGAVRVRPRDESPRARAMWGTYRSLIDSMVVGVSRGFTKDLVISGVGYRAACDGKTLTLQLGYSHEIVYPVPDGITITCSRPTTIAIGGADRQRVGQVAAEIRGFRRPEPY